MDPENLVKLVEAILVILAVFLPGFGVYLKKASTVAKKAAEQADVQAALARVSAEALADGNVDNEEIRKIMETGQKYGTETKELVKLIIDLITKSKEEK